MNESELIDAVEVVYQARLSDPEGFYLSPMQGRWNKYFIDCFSVDSACVDILNSNDIAFICKPIIMGSGEVLQIDDYAAWYFTYPGMAGSARKLLWETMWAKANGCA
jgi:hypothetical protein